MHAVVIPPDLLEKIEHTLSNGGSVDDFVRIAVEEKLDDTARRSRLHHLTAKIHEAMLAKGLTEDEILADFDQHRHAQGAAKP